MAKSIMIDRKKLEAYLGIDGKRPITKPTEKREPMGTPNFDENRANPIKEDSLSNTMGHVKFSY